MENVFDWGQVYNSTISPAVTILSWKDLNYASPTFHAFPIMLKETHEDRLQVLIDPIFEVVIKSTFLFPVISIIGFKRL